MEHPPTFNFPLWRLALVVFLLLFLGLLAAIVMAAEPLPPSEFSGAGVSILPRERPPLPSFQPETKPDIGLPPLASPPRAMLSSQARIRVKRIEVVGNTVFSRAELESVIAPYEHREISAEELQALRRQLTRYYVSRGYVSSGAVIPDQQVRDGVVTIRMIEGRLSGVEISGLKRLRQAYLRERLELGLDGPLNINGLGRNILALHDGPVIKRIKARLSPGERPGEGVLHAEVEEKDPWELRFQFANDRSPSVGGERLESYLAYHDLTGWADTLDFKGSLTEGAGDWATSYTRPLNAADTSLHLWYSRCNSDVVEAPFDTLDISSRTETYGLTLNYPFGRQDGRSWALGATLEHRHGDTSLLGHPFSFSPGEDDGEADDTAFRVSQEFLLRRPSRVVAFRQMLSFGIDGLGASSRGAGPDQNFLVWLTQAQWAERLGDRGVQLITRADMQLTREPLLYLERFAVGGASTVRGYRENLLVRDNGLIASMELRLPVGRMPLFGLSREVDDGLLQLCPFVDWGRSWNSEAPDAETKEIAGLGVGLRWDPCHAIHAQLYVACALNSDGIDHEEHDLQDSGIHFKLSYQAL
jgi:hemolysin activation/secretion protein